ncbi:MAG: putative membrane protein YeaQ/YmgE (transglycosylase-associated protein family) [Bacteroidia bacterium]|jgi:uncharacterized membrane protein YeaQ/YmgE (transglycosylase-associated protein family)
MKFLGFIILGAIAGWTANRLMKRGKKGFLRNLLLGIIGGFVGGWLFGIFNINLDNTALSQYFVAVIGAVGVVWIADKLSK